MNYYMSGEGITREHGPAPEPESVVKPVWCLGDGRNVLSNGEIVEDSDRKARFEKLNEEDGAWSEHSNETEPNDDDLEDAKRFREAVMEFKERFPEGGEVNLKEMVRMKRGVSFAGLRAGLVRLDVLNRSRQELYQKDDEEDVDGTLSDFFRESDQLVEKLGIGHNAVYVGEEAAGILDGDEKGTIVYAEWGEGRPGDSSYTTIVAKYGDKLLRYKSECDEYGSGFHTTIESLKDSVASEKLDLDMGW